MGFYVYIITTILELLQNCRWHKKLKFDQFPSKHKNVYVGLYYREISQGYKLSNYFFHGGCHAMVFHDRMPISNYISSYIAVRKTKRWLLFCSYILSLSKSSNSKGISLSYFFIPLSAKYITISPISFKPIQWVFQVSPSSQTRNNFIGNNTNEILWNFSLKRRIGGEIAKTQHNWWLNPQLDPIKPVKWPAITVKMWPCSVQWTLHNNTTQQNLYCEMVRFITSPWCSTERLHCESIIHISAKGVGQNVSEKKGLLCYFFFLRERPSTTDNSLIGFFFHVFYPAIKNSI